LHVVFAAPGRGFSPPIHLPHVGEGEVAARRAGRSSIRTWCWASFALFMYVGGEVSIGSSIINFLGQSTVAGLDPIEASKYVSLFWGGMLIGRFMGAVELSEMKPLTKQLALAAIPIGSLIALASLRGWVIAGNYLPLLGLCWLLFQFGKALAGRTLLIFSATIVALLLAAIVSGGKLAMWCIVGVGLFTSIGWPNIFSLALDGTGIYKSQVSSLLVMAILGGALLPPLAGHVADVAGLQVSFIVPLVAYAYVGFYGWIGHKIGKPRAAAQAD
jgi:MFS transporter, FHS family, L-fucose permease